MEGLSKTMLLTAIFFLKYAVKIPTLLIFKCAKRIRNKCVGAFLISFNLIKTALSGNAI